MNPYTNINISRTDTNTKGQVVGWTIEIVLDKARIEVDLSSDQLVQLHSDLSFEMETQDVFIK